MAIVQNYVIYKNADWEVAGRWESDEVPYELSDASLQIRRGDNDELLMDASVAGGEITLDPTDGWATVVILESAWAAIDYTGAAVYDLKVERASDSRTKILVTGDVVIKQGVTR